MNNNISFIIINDEKRNARGTNLYNIVIDDCRSLDSVLCRANGIVQKTYLDFQVEFEDGLMLPFMATFRPTDDGWVKLVDIIPYTEQGNMFI